MKLIERLRKLFKKKKKNTNNIDPNKTHEEYYEDFQKALQKDIETYKKNKGN